MPPRPIYRYQQSRVFRYLHITPGSIRTFFGYKKSDLSICHATLIALSKRRPFRADSC
ncbi:hypothetical protein Plhal304r1_c002g0006981 [Plasmopara halstedii]